ncbi:MAG: hypothetical protein QM279_03545 [Atribacterota bacterium]|nr:hypothetical protein [Atribacterota bacterium]
MTDIRQSNIIPTQSLLEEEFLIFIKKRIHFLEQPGFPVFDCGIR